ncbi:MAG: mechanosensitive ion channel [Bacteroidales bacterium]
MLFRQFIAVVIFLVSGHAAFAQQSLQADDGQLVSPPAENMAPVIFEDDTLFTLYGNIGVLTPRQRADDFTDILNKLSSELYFVEDSFHIVNLKNHSIIKYKKLTLMGVSQQDAEASGYERKYLAENYKEIIQHSLELHIQSVSFWKWVRQIGLTFVALAGLIFILVLVNKLFRRINKWFWQYENKNPRKWPTVIRYLLLEKSDFILPALVNVLKYPIFILIAILYLPVLLRFIPKTHDYIQMVYTSIVDAFKYVFSQIVDFLPNLVIIMIVILIARYFIKFLMHISHDAGKNGKRLRGFFLLRSKPLVILLKITINVLALIFILLIFPGADSTILAGILIIICLPLFLGFVVVFPIFTSGILIHFIRPFSLGDHVKIGDDIGIVAEITWLYIKIKTENNEEITILNTYAIKRPIWNFSVQAKQGGVLLQAFVYIGRETPWASVNELLIEAALASKQVLRNPKPFVHQRSIEIRSIQYELNLFTHEPGGQNATRSELLINIMNAFDAAGIAVEYVNFSSTGNTNKNQIRF